MTQKLLLIDFENVQPIDQAMLDTLFQVAILLGASQKNVPIGLVESAQKLVDRME
jgi:hypothetical protein